MGEGNGHNGETCANQLIWLLRIGTFGVWTTNPASRRQAQFLFSFRVGGGAPTPVLLQWRTLGSICLRPPKNEAASLGDIAQQGRETMATTYLRRFNLKSSLSDKQVNDF